MIKWINIVFAGLVLLIAGGCDKDKWVSDPNFNLEFSVDTLSFDTLFSGGGSVTLPLKVYNRASRRVHVSSVKLNGDSSPFRLNINGVMADYQEDLVIAANDSLYLFVEVSISPRDMDLPYKVCDSIAFDVNEKTQFVKLLAWGQDVNAVENVTLTTQNWNSPRPYLIKGSVIVDESQTLTLDKGCRLYFHKDAGLYVDGTLNVEGEIGNPVSMMGERLEELYDNIPGQWEGIFLGPKSKNHNINFLDVKNSKYGILCQGDQQNKLQINLSNCRILNVTGSGLSMSNASIWGSNILISNCGQQVLKIINGGECSFAHCTFTNYWQLSVRTHPVVEIESSSIVDFKNCLIFGTNNRELLFDDDVPNQSLAFLNCLIKFGESQLTQQSQLFKNCLFDKDPKFVDIQNNDFHLESDSPARDAGSVSVGQLIPQDLEGNNRTVDKAPDTGVYEFCEE